MKKIGIFNEMRLFETKRDSSPMNKMGCWDSIYPSPINVVGKGLFYRRKTTMKKKIISLLLAGVMALSMVACGGAKEEAPAASGEVTETSEAIDMKVAMITDSGDITDQSFNQTTYEACKAWAEANGVEFNYYKPESDADESRNASVDQAVADGANVIVMPGYMFAATVVAQSDMYPDVKFVALDVSAGDICEKGVGEG